MSDWNIAVNMHLKKISDNFTRHGYSFSIYIQDWNIVIDFGFNENSLSVTCRTKNVLFWTFGPE